MKISYLGHSCFAIEEDGYRIIFDPYKNGTVPGCGDRDEEADLVICSHGHDDHNAAELIRKRTGVPCPFALTTIHSMHDDHGGKLRGTNDITIVRGKMSAAHMGDIGCDLTDEQYDLLKGVDVLMIPVGGFFTIDAVTAAKMADRAAEIAGGHGAGSGRIAAVGILRGASDDDRTSRGQRRGVHENSRGDHPAPAGRRPDLSDGGASGNGAFPREEERSDRRRRAEGEGEGQSNGATPCGDRRYAGDELCNL